RGPRWCWRRTRRRRWRRHTRLPGAGLRRRRWRRGWRAKALLADLLALLHQHAQPHEPLEPRRQPKLAELRAVALLHRRLRRRRQPRLRQPTHTGVRSLQLLTKAKGKRGRIKKSVAFILTDEKPALFTVERRAVFHRQRLTRDALSFVFLFCLSTFAFRVGLTRSESHAPSTSRVRQPCQRMCRSSSELRRVRRARRPRKSACP